MSDLYEFHYIDEVRLNSYIEQIQPQGTTDKIPLWNVNLSTTGISVSRSKTHHSRPLTNLEKLKSLVSYLRKLEKGLSEKRPNSDTDYHLGPVFRLETCDAFRVLLPPKENETIPFNGFGLWISIQEISDSSESESLESSLYLLERSKQPDKDRGVFVSEFSALDHITQSFEPELRQSTIGERLLFWHDSNKFAKDPMECLEKLGAKTTFRRRITTLYRIRCGSVMHSPNGTINSITIGYPIVILEALKTL